MIAISVKDVHKSFKIYYDKGQSFKEKLLFRNRNKYENREVLKGISFDVKKGEAIGLIGKNGCGKSTLLKLMTQIIYPDKGSIKMNGRISSLIELGAGFHPDMSGRENIYTNASIFGLNRKEIDERIKQIIDFSELEEFIDNPVRTYSSGMYMRLAFAVAINVDADILLIDEILAVGDANFQAKCFNKLREIKANGTTIVIVSHALGQIEQICERSVWIEDGYIKLQGPPRDVHPYYLDFMGQKIINSDANKDKTGNVIKKDKNRFGNQEVLFSNICILDKNYNYKDVFRTGEEMIVELKYKHIHNVKSNIGISISNIDGVVCYGTNVLIEDNNFVDINADGKIQAVIEKLNLMPGKYFLDVAAYTEDNFPQDDIKKVLSFNIVSNKLDIGICKLNVKWIYD